MHIKFVGFGLEGKEKVKIRKRGLFIMEGNTLHIDTSEEAMLRNFNKIIEKKAAELKVERMRGVRVPDLKKVWEKCFEGKEEGSV